MGKRLDGFIKSRLMLFSIFKKDLDTALNILELCCHSFVSEESFGHFCKMASVELEECIEEMKKKIERIGSLLYCVKMPQNSGMVIDFPGYLNRIEELRINSFFKIRQNRRNNETAKLTQLISDRTKNIITILREIDRRLNTPTTDEFIELYIELQRIYRRDQQPSDKAVYTSWLSQIPSRVSVRKKELLEAYKQYRDQFFQSKFIKVYAQSLDASLSEEERATMAFDYFHNMDGEGWDEEIIAKYMTNYSVELSDIYELFKFQLYENLIDNELLRIERLQAGDKSSEHAVQTNVEEKQITIHQLLKQSLKGKKGKELALWVESASDICLLTLPKFPSLQKDYNVGGSASAFNKYYNKGCFTEKEKAPIRAKLKELSQKYSC